MCIRDSFFACKVGHELRRADDYCPGALGDGDGIAQVIGMAMRQKDVCRMYIVGTDGCRRVAREERVDEDVAGRRGDQESRMTKIGELLMCHSVVCLLLSLSSGVYWSSFGSIIHSGTCNCIGRGKICQVICFAIVRALPTSASRNCSCAGRRKSDQ